MVDVILVGFPKRNSSGEYADQFGSTLRQHFKDQLVRLQQRAKRLCNLPKCRVPRAPDLWLIGEGVHRFIEVKLPGDTIREPQLAGLALIATALSPVTVEMMCLMEHGSPLTSRQRGREEAREQEAETQFSKFRDRLVLTR